MEAPGGAAGGAPGGGPLRVEVKVGARSVALELGAGATLGELRSAVEARAGVFVREQRLICRGRVLGGAPGALLGQDLGVGPGRVKIMCLRAGGAPPARPPPAAARPRRTDGAAAARRPAPRARDPAPGEAAARGAAAGRTGVVACPGQGLRSVPAWAAGVESPEAVRVVDFSGNDLEDLGSGGRGAGTSGAGCAASGAGAATGAEGEAVGGVGQPKGAGAPAGLPWETMRGLQRLVAGGNARLTSGGVPWARLSLLPCLRVLDFGGCSLESLPEDFGRANFPALETLSLAGNRLKSLPDALGGLGRLRILDLSRNSVEALPGPLGGCSALEELDVSRNRIRALPSELGGLKKLKTLRADGNWVREVPQAILTGCEELATLGLHGNPISLQELQALEGFEAFEERRRKKYDKKVDMSVMGSEGFDQGADSEAHRCPRR